MSKEPQKMNEEPRKNIIKLLSENLRQDERGLDEFRDLEIELGAVKMAEGSARVKLGNTEVIAGVKLKVDKPFPDSPDKGILMVNTELSPLSSPEFESGPPSIRAIEASRVVDRGIREGKAVDIDKLCIEEGEKVWMISVDISPINYDGNLIDVGSIAALAAIYNTRMPKLDKDGNVDYDNKTDKKLPITEYPLSVTVIKIGDYYVVDPTENEEKVLDARITFNFRKDGNLCAVQKGGDGSVTVEDIKKMADIAEKVAKKNRKVFEKTTK